MGRLTELTVSAFAAEVASDSPAPGGGSCAAQAGAVGAGLVAMVARLSVGRQDRTGQGTSASDGELDSAGAEADELRLRLLALVDQDTVAFDAVMAALRLPKADEAQRAARSEALRGATLFAADVPLETLRCCRRVVELAASLAGRSNPAAASDLGTGVDLSRAGAEGAALNVAINLGSVTGADVDERRAAAGEAIAAVRDLAEQTSAGIRLGLG